ncbi:hypothetical protein [Streptomyces sp. NPDC096095]|uniref:hypothetical protein n=1 Tax=Streptomyces sp. NPDC096095 TaxID=3155545 RepID=UPI00331B90A4
MTAYVCRLYPGGSLVHFFATIPQPDGSNYNETFAPLIRALFAPERVARHGPYYFVRTRDARLGAEALQISVDGVTDPDAFREELRSIVQRHGHTARVEEIPLVEAPSPLWNAGFAGPGFEAASKRLFQRAAPVLVAFLNRSAVSGSALPAALGALRLMVAHTQATLLNSPQRNLPYQFGDLLSLRLLSYRSHYEAIYLRTKNPDSFEAACARFYEQAGPAVREFIAACGDPDAEHLDDLPAEQWTGFVKAGTSQLAETFLHGSILNAGETLEDLVQKRGGPVEPTRFHTPPSPELDALMHRDTDFLAFRMQTSLLYSSLYSLGFSLAERYVFCYVVARANEEVRGRSMAELQSDLDDLARSMAPVSAKTAG